MRMEISTASEPQSLASWMSTLNSRLKASQAASIAVAAFGLWIGHRYLIRRG